MTYEEQHGQPALPRPDLKPPAGWSLELITAIARPHHPQLAPDGRQVAFIWQRDGLSDVYTMPTAGGWPRRITTHRGPLIDWLDRGPRWSPDGRWLAWEAAGHTWVAPGDGRGATQCAAEHLPTATAPVWMPDSQSLIVSVTRGECANLALTDWQPAGRPPHTTLLTWSEAGDAWDAQPSPDGRQIVYVYRPLDDLNRLELWRLDRPIGTRPAAVTSERLTGEPHTKDWFPRWSPDGRWIAFLSQRSGWNGIWLIRPDGRDLHPLTQLEQDVGEFVWSPDGRRLAVTLNRGGAFDLALVDVATGRIEDVQMGQGVYSDLAWGPAGDWLLAAYEAPTHPPDFYRIAVGGRQATGRTALTFSNLPALEALPLATPTRVRYPSADGLEIEAFLYRPANPNGAAILYPHGGPSFQYLYQWDIWAQYFVAKGYTYLAPNYRGSTGYGVAFEHANYGDWGQGDMQDCLAGARFLHTLPWIDPARIAIAGGSYGGYLVACCLARDPDYLFACGVSRYGDAHPLTSWAQCERETRLYTEMMMGHPGRQRAAYRQAAPIYEIEHIRRPILLLHGQLDDIVPPQASAEWAQALRQAGKTFEYKVYPDEPHGFLKRANEMDMLARMERFLDWYLM